MEMNMGPCDRKVRMTVGVLALIIGIWLKNWWGLIGLILVVTSFFGVCPAYIPFKFNTLKMGAKASTVKPAKKAVKKKKR